MSKAKQEKKTRNTVAVPSDIGEDLEQILPSVGVDNVAQLTRMGLRYIFRKIKAGELVNLNGELAPAGK